jgi:hypothetical protein
MAKEFAGYPGPGRCAALVASCAAFENPVKSMPQTLAIGLTALVRQAGRDADAEVRGCGLELAEKAEQGVPAELRQACLEAAHLGLKDSTPANRARAVRVAAQPAHALRNEVVLALRDPEAEVRREAVRAVGPWDDTVATEDLLVWLHDPDAGVRHACEQVLREDRKLTEEHVEMGRLVTDARPAMRVRVVNQLHDGGELDLNVWLRRLSHDPSAAVRAATVRAAIEQHCADLVDRIEQIAGEDPSPTVRQLARFYISVGSSN